MALSAHGGFSVSDAFRWNDRYAGDAAWAEWFEICSVAGCSPESAAALRSEIESAMYAHLRRHGLTREDAQGEDPVAFFDAYFKLRGGRDVKKPLKSYYAYRLVTEGKTLQDFICGTLFGSASGRIRDIVLDWVAALKGWRARTVSREDGSRGLEWENAGFAETSAQSSEPQESRDPAQFVDEAPYRLAAESVIGRVAAKIKAEKTSVALCLYVTAMDISVTEPVVLSALGLAKSRAYAVREKAMAALEKALADVEGADDPLFARVLVETCERMMGEELMRKLGEAL